MKCFTGHFYFFNTSNADYDDKERERVVYSDGPTTSHAHNAAGDSCGQLAIRAVVPDPERSLGGFAHPDLDGRDIQIFDYYVHGLCPQLSNSVTENPYLELLAPLSMESLPVYHSILSCSSHELALRDPSMLHYRQSSVMHKVKALQYLQDNLRRSQDTTGHSHSELISILATMIVLSCQEITESCSAAWITHLKAARTLCSLLWPTGLHINDRFRRFSVMWLVSHEMMSRTAWVEHTLFEPSEWFHGENEWEIDGMIGCSRGLIRQVSEIGELIMERRLDALKTEIVPFQSRRDRIERTLQSLGQHIPSNATTTPPELQDIAESKRLCALIYFYTCIDDSKPCTPIIQEHTAAVVKLLRRLPSKPSLTFPLFVVGTLGVWNEDDRRIVMDKFTDMIQERPLASIKRAFDIVKAVWLDRDLGRHHRWEDLVEIRGQLLSLA